MSARKKIRVGVVGFGWMGQAHTRSILRIPTLFPEREFDAELVMISDNMASRVDQAVADFGFGHGSVDWNDLIANDDIDVVKAKLDTNRELRIWLMQHGVKIAALPTLVLVRDGKPVRTLFGARDIMSEDKLHAFAFDESDEPPVTKPAFDPSAVFSAISSKMSKMRLAF